ncbi:MAG TPA: AIR synthase-related protein, partial [Gemmatimonadaceae bacterium]|nr:AIR synthase-related protein [Gemmatimonadaceae bacterium]
AIKGMGEACSALSTPVTGGNVSLYNESPGGAVYPTPVVGMVGLAESVTNITRSTFDAPGDIILLMGNTKDELGGSEYLSEIHGIVAGQPPECDLAAERRAIDALLEAIGDGAVSSAHDCSDGGLAVALAEACIAERDSLRGVDVDLTGLAKISTRGIFFGESQGRYVISSNFPEDVERVMSKHGVPVKRIGKVTSAENGFHIRFGNHVIDSDVETLADAWHDAIPAVMSAPSVAAEQAAMTVA